MYASQRARDNCTLRVNRTTRYKLRLRAAKYQSPNFSHHVRGYSDQYPLRYRSPAESPFERDLFLRPRHSMNNTNNESDKILLSREEKWGTDIQAATTVAESAFEIRLDLQNSIPLRKTLHLAIMIHTDKAGLKDKRNMGCEMTQVSFPFSLNARFMTNDRCYNLDVHATCFFLHCRYHLSIAELPEWLGSSCVASPMSKFNGKLHSSAHTLCLLSLSLYLDTSPQLLAAVSL